MALTNRFPRLERWLSRYTFDVFLTLLALLCICLMLVSSSDPVVSILEGTALHQALGQFQTGNQIAFDLSVGLLASVFMYYLVVRVPELKKRRRIRANLATAYESFKKDSIAVYLRCLEHSYPAELPGTLTSQVAFRDFFKQPFASGQDRWHGVANGLNDDRLRALVIELEILMQEIHFTLSAVDVQDRRAFEFLKRLSQVLYRSKNWTTDYDDVKSMLRFLWSVHTGWSWLDGYADSDPVLEMISAI